MDTHYAAAACPCYSAAEVAEVASCDDPVTLCFQSSGEYLCEIQCPGGTYDYFLSSDLCAGPRASSSLDAGQFQACFDVLQAECPSFDAF
jgi:hypothetical protein